ncbi:VirB4 family type IV secretion system protein [Cohaesibacter celericrescens]|uniref:Type IV secretion system protein B4 n=1 Tax=Cohaesibacter celericrescens TaxID=2067669 RepID=A0A2N5XRN9_9HYPH|nr:VirB4 family type IV secretion system protein [Cohaesibacter celericrescens]PLW77182.1 type IV secretion system protein B4 [Cohaesibacter celericrescens]
MIFKALLIGSTALAVGALFHPKSSTKLLGDIDVDWLAYELEFDQILADDQTVSLKSGQYMRVYSLSGVPYETRSLADQEALARSRATAFHQFLKPASTMRFFGIKRSRDVSYQSDWPTCTLKEIGEAEQKIYRNAYSQSWYLVLTCPTASDLEKTCRGLVSAFDNYAIRPVLAASDLEQPCELTSFINYLITGEFMPNIGRVSKSISANVPACDLNISIDGVIKTTIPTEHVNKIIAVRGWPETLSGILISKILALSAEIEVVQIAKPLDSTQQIALFTRTVQEQKHNFFGTFSQLAEYEGVLEDLLNDEHHIFETQFQIAARNRNPQLLDVTLEQITAILDQARVLYSVETKGAAVAWFNRMPARDKLIRPLRLFESNLATLWPFQFSPVGMWRSPFGDRPIRLFKTPTGQNYALQFHVSDKPQSPGNYIVFAPTGSGKSTLIMHLLSGLAKFPKVRNYVFDSKDGARFMVEAMGGVYQGYDQLALNPLDTDLEDKAAKLRALQIFRLLLGNEYTDDMDAVLSTSLDLAGYLPIGERTLNNIFAGSFPKLSPERRILAKWISDDEREGQYSHVFNSPRDQITGFLEKSFLAGINMNEALEDPVLGPPVIAHIATAISQVAQKTDGGFSIFIDEAANLLRNEGFRKLALEMYREYRKLDGLVGLAFQEPGALLSVEGASGIIENAQTMFFFPNSNVDTKNLEPFNLSNEQIAFIKGEGDMRGGRQVMVVKRFEADSFNESAIIDIDLSPYGDALRFYRSGPAPIRELNQVKSEWGDQWLSHI